MIYITIIGMAASFNLILTSGITYPLMSLIGLVLFVLNGFNFIKEIKKETK